ncbi:NAD-dependent epimerase [Vreelandella lutescens]|uniref:NAD-dependent epimerase n=1 Tax=Vreelandella lutescens TaxID=1602943 RepID=A0ABQ1NYT5_9GAMM|nr:NAD-dependent epimerase [Halomonas lutescens]GGC87735.1 NAD-dependent epimerase [Halomonas lutescens]
MSILVSGTAGFIGAAVAYRLLERGDTVIGIDNHNSYYDPTLKEARVDRLSAFPNYTHLRIDVADRAAMAALFKQYAFQQVIHLAAQVGVRYSLENPAAYIDSNLVGFSNILEGCRQKKVEHLVYASSSSVYGANEAMPFATHHSTDHPISLYAATKKANESMAHTYSHLYGIPTTGLRFFTVYGPWGRPDMALFKFTKAILEGNTIPVYHYGEHRRDFTYIDDIVEGVIRVLDRPAQANSQWSGLQPNPASSKAPWRLYNIGNQKPVVLMNYISALEKALGMTAQKELLPMQPGDVPDTYADVEDLVSQFNYQPATRIEDGVNEFVTWYRDFYHPTLSSH